MNELEKKIKAISEYALDKAKRMPETAHLKVLLIMDELQRTLMLLAEEDIYNAAQGKFENEFLNAIDEIGYDEITKRIGDTTIKAGAARILRLLTQDFACRHVAGEDTTDLYEFFTSDAGATLAHITGSNRERLLITVAYVTKCVAAVKG